MCLGAVIALLGICFFGGARAIVMPPAGQNYNPYDVNLHEAMWSAFGIGLMLCGTIVAAVGLAAWCRSTT